MLVKKSSQSIFKRQVKKEFISHNKLRMQKVSFDNGTMLIYLDGGRILSVPLSKYPEIRKLTKDQRKNYHIAGGISLDFDDRDEVYHIEELLGLG